MAWTQRASDNFNTGANAANLTTGGVWTARSGTLIYRPAQPAEENASASLLNLYSYTGTTFLSDQYAQATLLNPTGTVANCGIALRVQAASASGYALAFDNGNLAFYRYDSGSFNNLISVSRTSYVGGTKIRVEITGVGSASRLTAYEDTGSGFTAVSTMTNYDPSAGGIYYNGGSPGLYGFSGFFGWTVSAWSSGDWTTVAAVTRTKSKFFHG